MYDKLLNLVSGVVQARAGLSNTTKSHRRKQPSNFNLEWMINCSRQGKPNTVTGIAATGGFIHGKLTEMEHW